MTLVLQNICLANFITCKENDYDGQHLVKGSSPNLAPHIYRI